jgi:hypothetical protein
MAHARRAQRTLMINQVSFDIAWPIRLNGHILGGIWILTSSLLTGAKAIQVVGGITGIWLAAYSFVGTLLPDTFLRPAGVLIIIWFALLAILGRPVSPQPGTTATPTNARTQREYSAIGCVQVVFDAHDPRALPSVWRDVRGSRPRRVRPME